MTEFTGTSESQIETHVVMDPADALIVSHRAREFAVKAGFPHPGEIEMGIVARELATNILRHAGQGSMTLRAEGPRMVIEASDDGPGIADSDLAFVDGYTTSGGFGYGLGTVNRLMDHVEIASRPGGGSVVTAHRSVRSAGLARPSPVEVGVATLPKPGFAENGDGYVIHSWDSKLMVGVLDGVGHGAPAKAATQKALSYIAGHFDQPLEGIFRGLEITCCGTRGVVIALARFDWAAQTVEFASIGNIEARVFGTQPGRSLTEARHRGSERPRPLGEDACLVIAGHIRVVLRRGGGSLG
jgi:anti-sigma regulatory factor (Ser/Thr protein kinase)